MIIICLLPVSMISGIVAGIYDGKNGGRKGLILHLITQITLWVIVLGFIAKK